MWKTLTIIESNNSYRLIEYRSGYNKLLLIIPTLL